MKSKIFAVRNASWSIDLALLIARIVCGAAFILHGWGKIQNPFHWMGAEAPIPAFLQGLAALSEFGGGIALILGLITRLGALGIVFTMIVAVITHLVALGDPFVSPTGGHSAELAASYLMLSLLFLVLGAGRFSLDRLLFGIKD